MKYQEKAEKLNLSQTRYWNLLLHMTDGESEIDDKNFFLAKDGQINAKSELNATIYALLNEDVFDDNSTACRFPARKAWLKEELNIIEFPEVKCIRYNDILKRLNPKSATIVFPAAHINSPASMFGHTFLRVNSAYNSKLLSYAVNYAANVDPDKENGAVFAFKGLFGGYFGRFSLLPYYEKLKEYRDSEQRDIWEYNLNLTEDEVLRMVEHIWELNGAYSNYYFITENCSYNMLWLIEVARPSIHLREYFNYQVLPLETVHAAKFEGIINDYFYRPSKRTIILKYEDLLQKEYIDIPLTLSNSDITLQEIIANDDIDIQQKKYILEASIELLEYKFSRSKIKKESYLKIFHNISKARASLGLGEQLNITTPSNPIDSHQAIRLSISSGFREGKPISFLGLRQSYHDLEDNHYGFLRGTQIEFFNVELSYLNDEVEVDKATILSIVSIAQRSEFFKNLSWRINLGWDKNYLDYSTNFATSVGIGLSWGNKLGYFYLMTDPILYQDNGFKTAIGGSIGFIIDNYDFMSTNVEITRRIYEDGNLQWLAVASQSFRLSQSFQLKFNYNYKDRHILYVKSNEETYKMSLNYYF